MSTIPIRNGSCGGDFCHCVRPGYVLVLVPLALESHDISDSISYFSDIREGT